MDNTQSVSWHWDECSSLFDFGVEEEGSRKFLRSDHGGIIILQIVRAKAPLR